MSELKRSVLARLATPGGGALVGTTPETFDAMGNGVADDTAAFNAFATWAKAQPAGTTVVLNCTAGKTYTYALPYWPFSIPNLIVNGNGATFKCTAINQDDMSPLWTAPGPQLGTPGESFQPVTFKLLESTTVGATSVTTVTASDAGAFNIGETIMLGSYDMLFSGQPPCLKYFEYPIVESVNGSTGVIGLDRPVKNAHLSTYPTYSSMTAWTGAAAAYKVEQGGLWNINHTYNDLNFVTANNPSWGFSSVYCTGRRVVFNRCTAPVWLPTSVGHVTYNDCDQTYAGSCEFDKLNEIIEVKGGLWPATITSAFGTNTLRFERAKLFQGYRILPKTLEMIDCDVRNPLLSQANINGYGKIASLILRGGEHTQLPQYGTNGPDITIGSSGVTLSGDVLSVPINPSTINGFITKAEMGAVVSVTAANSGSQANTGNFGTITSITGNGTDVLFTLQMNTALAGTESLNIWEEPDFTEMRGLSIGGVIAAVTQDYVSIARNKLQWRNLVLASGQSAMKMVDGIPTRMLIDVIRPYTGSTAGNIKLQVERIRPNFSDILNIDLTTAGVREATWYGNTGFSGTNGESAGANLTGGVAAYAGQFAWYAPAMAGTVDQMPIVSIEIDFRNTMFARS
jgi:hypothetical protein